MNYFPAPGQKTKHMRLENNIVQTPFDFVLATTKIDPKINCSSICFSVSVQQESMWTICQTSLSQ